MSKLCNRRDGRKWLCGQPAFEGKSLCETHFLQSKLRQNKEPVPDDLKFERQSHRKNHQKNDEIKPNASKKAKKKVSDYLKFERQRDQVIDEIRSHISKKGKRKVLDDDPVVITLKSPSIKPKKSKSSSESSGDMGNIENLINEQCYQSVKQHNELILMVASLQKQIELQALEAKHREQEIRKHAEEMVSNLQKQMEDQALEAKRREQEIERRAEVRAHAIIFEIEKLRSINEQERVSLNQGDNVDTSSHLQHVVSKYYDSTQGDEIPKEIQSIYGDILGPKS